MNGICQAIVKIIVGADADAGVNFHPSHPILPIAKIMLAKIINTAATVADTERSNKPNTTIIVTNIIGTNEAISF